MVTSAKSNVASQNSAPSISIVQCLVARLASFPDLPTRLGTRLRTFLKTVLSENVLENVLENVHENVHENVLKNVHENVLENACMRSQLAVLSYGSRKRHCAFVFPLRVRIPDTARFVFPLHVRIPVARSHSRCAFAFTLSSNSDCKVIR